MGGFGLSADSNQPPRAAALVAYHEDALRDGEPPTVVDWLPYDGRPEQLWRDLCDRGIPSHVAVDLVLQLSRRPA